MSGLIAFVFGGLIMRAWHDFKEDLAPWAVWDLIMAAACLAAWIISRVAK